MRLVRIGITAGFFFAAAGLVIDKFIDTGARSQIPEFILTASAAIPSVLAEVILSFLQISKEGTSPIVICFFIFGFWMTTGFVFGWIFTAKNAGQRVLAILILAGIIFSYRAASLKYRKEFADSLAPMAGAMPAIMDVYRGVVDKK